MYVYETHMRDNLLCFFGVFQIVLLFLLFLFLLLVCSLSSSPSSEALHQRCWEFRGKVAMCLTRPLWQWQTILENNREKKKKDSDKRRRRKERQNSWRRRRDDDERWKEGQVTVYSYIDRWGWRGRKSGKKRQTDCGDSVGYACVRRGDGREETREKRREREREEKERQTFCFDVEERKRDKKCIGKKKRKKAKKRREEKHGKERRRSGVLLKRDRGKLCLRVRNAYSRNCLNFIWQSKKKKE